MFFKLTAWQASGEKKAIGNVKLLAYLAPPVTPGAAPSIQMGTSAAASWPWLAAAISALLAPPAAPEGVWQVGAQSGWLTGADSPVGRHHGKGLKRALSYVTVSVSLEPLDPWTSRGSKCPRRLPEARINPCRLCLGLNSVALGATVWAQRPPGQDLTQRACVRETCFLPAAFLVRSSIRIFIF